MLIQLFLLIARVNNVFVDLRLDIYLVDGPRDFLCHIEDLVTAQSYELVAWVSKKETQRLTLGGRVQISPAHHLQ